MQQLVCSGLSVGYEGKPVAPPIDFAVERETMCAFLGKTARGNRR